MKIHKILIVDQNSQIMSQLAQKNNTSYGTCGYITLALTTYLANLQNFNQSSLANISVYDLIPSIENVMKHIANTRKLELKKFYKLMNETERKWYLKDYVANFEIAQYLDYAYDSLKNKQIFFFRQCAYDHPQKMNDTKWQQRQKIAEQEQFKGQKFFYSSFGQYSNNHKEQFEQILRNTDPKKPVIIATDILGHYYTTVLFQGQIYVLDSLTSYLQTQFDSSIVECIHYLYKQSYLIKEKEIAQN